MTNKALSQVTQSSESLADELRITRAERDLLQGQLNKFKRQEKRYFDELRTIDDIKNRYSPK